MVWVKGRFIDNDEITVGTYDRLDHKEPWRLCRTKVSTLGAHYGANDMEDIE